MGFSCRSEPRVGLFQSLADGVWRFLLLHHHLPPVEDFSRSDAEWLFQSQVANLGVGADRFVLFLGPP